MAEFAPRKAPPSVSMRGRNYTRIRRLRAGQTFIIVTQEKFSFLIMMLKVESISRRAGFATIKVAPNNYGIVEITFDEEAMVVVLPEKDK